MRNKFYIFIISIFFYSILIQDLKIESKITLDKNNNKLIFENRVVITTSDGKKIVSDFMNITKT